ncbi:hypothetical protein DFH08DRAFT_814750 [Mycena albidolilacea]|uniref:Uncharacterized protein n=1 Tax=Mycena albidolilacea TaxID=1033008 RepID=A0AAD6ZPH6_9AGAR|nr:hypothetical protein DFH08DRAFT_814750 [Mycena albidolilacea]
MLKDSCKASIAFPRFLRYHLIVPLVLAKRVPNIAGYRHRIITCICAASRTSSPWDCVTAGHYVIGGGLPSPISSASPIVDGIKNGTRFPKKEMNSPLSYWLCLPLSYYQPAYPSRPPPPLVAHNPSSCDWDVPHSLPPSFTQFISEMSVMVDSRACDRIHKYSMHYRPVLSLNYMPLLFLSSPGADRVHLFSSRFRVGCQNSDCAMVKAKCCTGHFTEIPGQLTGEDGSNPCREEKILVETVTGTATAPVELERVPNRRNRHEWHRGGSLR